MLFRYQQSMLVPEFRNKASYCRYFCSEPVSLVSVGYGLSIIASSHFPDRCCLERCAMTQLRKKSRHTVTLQNLAGEMWGCIKLTVVSLASSGVRIARYQHCVFRVLHPQLFALSEGALQLL